MKENKINENKELVLSKGSEKYGTFGFLGRNNKFKKFISRM